MFFSVMEDECPGPGVAYGHTANTCPDRHIPPVKALVPYQLRELFIIYAVGIVFSTAIFLTEVMIVNGKKIGRFLAAITTSSLRKLGTGFVGILRKAYENLMGAP